MKLILIENVPSLGYKGDVVEVKDGYGRNYLIPQHKAIIASNAALKQLEETNRQRAHKLAKMLEEAQAQAAKLEGVALTIAAKASKTGTIFGSVGVAHVAEALEKLGHEVDRKVIYIAQPIKELGQHTVVLKLHKEVEVPVELTVVAEETDEVAE